MIQKYWALKKKKKKMKGKAIIVVLYSCMSVLKKVYLKKNVFFLRPYQKGKKSKKSKKQIKKKIRSKENFLEI